MGINLGFEGNPICRNGQAYLQCIGLHSSCLSANIQVKVENVLTLSVIMQKLDVFADDFLQFLGKLHYKHILLQ
jgi:hypothetical protein